MIYRAGNHETFNGGSRRHSPFGISKSGEIRVSLFTVGMKVNVLKATITGDLFKNYATSRSVIPVQDKISKVPVVHLIPSFFILDWHFEIPAPLARKKSKLSPPVLPEKILILYTSHQFFFRYLSQKTFFLKSFSAFLSFFQITLVLIMHWVGTKKCYCRPKNLRYNILVCLKSKSVL